MGKFLYNGNTGLKQANPIHPISIYYFLLSYWNSSPFSPNAQTNQIYFSQKHNTKNENWKFIKQ